MLSVQTHAHTPKLLHSLPALVNTFEFGVDVNFPLY